MPNTKHEFELTVISPLGDYDISDLAPEGRRVVLYNSHFNAYASLTLGASASDTAMLFQAELEAAIGNTNFSMSVIADMPEYQTLEVEYIGDYENVNIPAWTIESDQPDWGWSPDMVYDVLDQGSSGSEEVNIPGNPPSYQIHFGGCSTSFNLAQYNIGEEKNISAFPNASYIESAINSWYVGIGQTVSVSEISPGDYQVTFTANGVTSDLPYVSSSGDGSPSVDNYNYGSDDIYEPAVDGTSERQRIYFVPQLNDCLSGEWSILGADLPNAASYSDVYAALTGAGTIGVTVSGAGRSDSPFEFDWSSWGDQDDNYLIPSPGTIYRARIAAEITRTQVGGSGEAESSNGLFLAFCAS